LASEDKPVRATPLKAGFFGTQYYDEQERHQVEEVIKTRQPFRWYGPGSSPPLKVATFERELAARMGTRFALADLGHRRFEHGHGRSPDRAGRRSHPPDLDLVFVLQRHCAGRRSTSLCRNRRVV
jgi:hypothetical protein